MAERPTKKQHELLSFIDGFIKGNGYGPSYREIMRALDYKSVSTVATHVDGLITRGWLVKKDNSARSLAVLMPESVSIKSSPAAAEKELRNKLNELRSRDDPPHGDIATLEQALTLLGYEVEDKPIV